MLVISLFFSAILLWFVNRAVRQDRSPVPTILGGGATFTFGPMCFFMPVPIVLQALFLIAGYGVWRWFELGKRAFLTLSVTVTVLAYAVMTGWAVKLEQDNMRLRERFPMESLEDRLPEVRAGLPTDHLSFASRTRLDQLEDAVEDEARGRAAFFLRLLHDDAVMLFINSPGFGVSRMPRPDEWRITSALRKDPVPCQPGFDELPSWAVGSRAEVRGGERDSLAQMHEAGVLDFVYPKGFGFVKDRQHVAGFQPHQFSQVPKPADRWAVETLSLVSLLLHDEPVVYVSTSLPKMDEVRNVPTRPLGGFESEGLKVLRQGEDLFVQPAGDRLQMLGALRATKQCVACHGGQRGDLLGAFSYTLRPTQR